MKTRILEKALKGEAFTEIEIIDAHCHMGTFYPFYFPAANIEEMLEDADAVGVDKLCIAPHASISCDYRMGNRQAAAAAAKYPERVWGLLTLNPHKPEEIPGEFDLYYGTDAFVGVKIHPALHHADICAEGYKAVYDIMSRRGGFILTHTWESAGSTCGIDACERIIKAYPGIAFILGHAGGTGEGAEKVIRLANRYENAYLDTSGFEYSGVWIEDIAGKTDCTKILFGSDCPYHDIRSGISRILFSGMDDDIKVGIMGKNFMGMLGKFPKT